MNRDPRNSFTAYWSESYFPALDGVRAFCVLLVIGNHMHEKLPPVVAGALGVDVFFVLSGFLITTLLLREKERYGSVSLKGFYARRAFRILPVYFVVLLLYFPIIWLTRDLARWHELKAGLPYLVTFTQEFRPATAGNVYGQTWSLGYEEKFYLIWPLLVLLLYPFRGRRIFILLLIGVALLFLPAMASRAYGGLFLGSLLGVLLDRSTGSRLQQLFPRINTWLALCLSVAAYFLVGFHKIPILIFSAMVTVFVATLVLRRSVIQRFLALPWIVNCGKRSYAMYLVHVLALNGVVRIAQKLRADVWFVVLPLTFAVSYIVATMLYYLVEKPSIERGRAISKRLRASHSAVQPASTSVEPAPIVPIENPVDV